MKKTKLSEFIRTRDPVKLALALGVTTQTVYNWRNGSVLPLPDLAKKLKILTRKSKSHKLDYNIIYGQK